MNFTINPDHTISINGYTIRNVAVLKRVGTTSSYQFEALINNRWLHFTNPMGDATLTHGASPTIASVKIGHREITQLHDHLTKQDLPKIFTLNLTDSDINDIIESLTQHFGYNHPTLIKILEQHPKTP